MDGDPTREIIGLAVRVHSRLGPGLLESAYERCLRHEVQQHGMEFRRQVVLPIEYDGLMLTCGYRADLVVWGTVLVEIKWVDRIIPVHEAQLLTYPRVSRYSIGLLLNFNTISLKDGIRRRVL